MPTIQQEDCISRRRTCEALERIANSLEELVACQKHNQ